MNKIEKIRKDVEDILSRNGDGHIDGAEEIVLYIAHNFLQEINYKIKQPPIVVYESKSIL